MAHISELRMKNRWKYEQNKQDSKHINTHQTGPSLVSSSIPVMPEGEKFLGCQ